MESLREEAFEKSLRELNIAFLTDDQITKLKPAIGEGGFGKVYKGKLGEISVAIKKIKLKEDEEDESHNVYQDILNEIQVIVKADNPNIPKFYGIWKRKGFYHLIFEFINGKSLKNCYSDMDKRTKLQVMRDFLTILASFHEKKLIHRDIKPDNIMVEEGNKPILIDFGVSKIAKKTSTYTAIQKGTMPFMSPEMFFATLDDEENLDDAEAKTVPVSTYSDIWSVGCMISELFSNVRPWNRVNKSYNDMQLQGMFCRREKFPIPQNIDEDVKNLLEATLKLDPEERPNANQLKKLIEDILVTLDQK